MNQPPVRIWALCSVKGGVGKSSLAAGLARVLARRGRKPLVVDADLTGTSLADGLNLCAPRVAQDATGALDLEAPPTGSWMDRNETLRVRDARSLLDGPGVAPPPYFNDVVQYRGTSEEQDCRIDALTWRMQPDDGVAYLPSSSLPQDVGQALAWLSLEEPLGPWTRRFAWILVTIADQMPETSDILIDLPPGLFGFSNEVLSLLAYVHGGRQLPAGFPRFEEGPRSWAVKALLVTSSDRSDLYCALEAYVALLPQLPVLVPVVNRRTEPPEVVKKRLRDRFAQTGFAAMRLEDKLVWVDEHATMSRIFKQGSLDLADNVEADLAAIIEGSRS